MRKMDTQVQAIVATIGVLSLGIIVAGANIGSVIAASDQERYNIGHHVGYDELHR